MILSWTIAFVLIVLTVIIHYEVLRLVARHIDDLILPLRLRFRMVLIILTIFMTHIVEIILFAAGLYFADNVVGIGGLRGNVVEGSFGDYLYFSMVSYTTLGFGDIYPAGGLRFIIGVEALTGLLMITWSASFTFLYMEKFWRLGDVSDRGET